MRNLGWVGLVACGCGSGGTTTITLEARDAAFLAVSHGDEGFEPIPLEDDFTYELEVEGRYGIARTCVDGTEADTGVIFRVPADDDDWIMNCTTPDRPIHRLTITSVDNSALLATCRGVAGNGNELLLMVPEGPCELLVTDFAMPGPRTKFWRQNLEVTGDMTLAVDLREAAELVRPDITIEAQEEQLLLSYFRSPRGTYDQFSTAEPSAKVPPSSALLPGDVVGIEAYDGFTIARAGFRFAADDAVDESTALTLTIPTDVPGLDFRITGGRPAVRIIPAWSGGPRWLEARDGERRMWADSSPAYAEERSHEEIVYADLPSLDGWDPAWSLTDTADVEYGFSMVHELGDGSFQELRHYPF